MMMMTMAQSCPTLCDPMDCRPSGSSDHGILQAKILEWVAIPFSRGSQVNSFSSEPPGKLVVKNLPANSGDVGDMGSISGLGRSPGGGNGNPLQYSFLDNPMNRGAP